MIRHAVASAIAIATAALATPAVAATITYTTPISASGPVAVALIGLPEFDPALGTLDSIGVEISGVLSVNTVLAPFQTIPLPIVAFDATGAGGRGFDFAGDGASFRFASVINPSPTVPLPIQLVTNFTTSFQVTALSDLTGVIVPATSSTASALIPPTNVAAQRSDFIQGIVPIGINETLVFSASGFVATGIVVAGSMSLTYSYTPAVAPGPVPAPGAFALLAGLTLLIRRRRR